MTGSEKRRPRIAITVNPGVAAQYYGTYARAIEEAGAEAVLVQPGDEVNIEGFDGLLLHGGWDVEPKRYGREPHPRLGRTEPRLDALEIDLARRLRARRRPVLGICRGQQTLNVAAGGTLYQDLAAWCDAAIKHDYCPDEPRQRTDLVHEVIVEPRTQLASIIGAGATTVNSMHHQGIKKLAPGLVVNARAPDGLIEGVEGADDGYLLGVQWHPEELVESDPAMRRLFESFIESATAYQPEVATR